MPAAVKSRRFPAPWSIEDLGACFVAKDRCAEWQSLDTLDGAGGATPGFLRLTMDRLLDRTCGERPRASRLVRVTRLDLPNV